MKDLPISMDHTVKYNEGFKKDSFLAYLTSQLAEHITDEGPFKSGGSFIFKTHRHIEDHEVIAVMERYQAKSGLQVDHYSGDLSRLLVREKDPEFLGKQITVSCPDHKMIVHERDF